MDERQGNDLGSTADDVALELNETRWHDGVLHALILEGTRGQTDCVLEVSVYASEQAKDRHRLTVRLLQVSEFEASIRADELRDHWGPGNITAAAISRKNEGVEFVVRVVEKGSLRIVAQDYRVSTPTG